jgi:stalled ribosome alternative rescue factor ArfA
MIMNKKMFKKTGEELQEYLRIMRKHSIVPEKKGKGSYTRKNKHKGADKNDI